MVNSFLFLKEIEGLTEIEKVRTYYYCFRFENENIRFN